MSVPSTDPRWPKVLSLSVHEFRTPMTVVAGYIRMLLKDRAGPLSDQQRKLLEEAEKSCARLSALLAEVSELSNLEAGTAPLNKGQVDLNAALRDAVNGLAPLPDRDVPVALDLDGAPRPVSADPVRMTQAFGAVIAAIRREMVGDEPAGRAGACGGRRRTKCCWATGRQSPRWTREDPAGRGVFDEWRGGVGLSLAVARRHSERARRQHRRRTRRAHKAGARILFRLA